MKRPKFQVNPVLAFSVLSTVNVLLWSPPVLALDPSLDVSQYAHTAWRISEGFATGEIQHLAQTPDGYLWVATEFGLLRFDGVRTVPWEPPAREHLPSNDINSLIAARDGTLWIGTAKGLVSWKNGNLTHYPQLDNHFVAALLEDHEGTVWAAGVVWETAFSGPGKLCAIKGDAIQCYGTDGSFGFGVTALYEDSRSNLWLGAGNGLWRWRPRPSIHHMPPGLDQFANPGLVFPPGSLLEGDHGALLIGGRNGIKQLVDGKLQDYPLPSATLPLNNAAPLLRDRNGGLWIGTRDVGLLHVHQGRMDVFAQSDGLSGNNIRSLFEDREGSIWVATTSGLDRFREYAIPTITVEQGLSSHFVVCVLAAKDGSVWLGTGDGLNRWKEGRITVYRRPSGGAAPERIDTAASQGRREEVYRIPSAKQPVPMAHEVISSALPDNHVTSLFQDAHGRIWVSTIRGLAYFENDRLVRLKDVQVTSLSPITGDSAGSLWVTNNSGGLYRLSGGRVTGHFPWAKLGILGSFSAPLVTDPVNGGLWLGSWSGGVIYFKDGQVRASYGPAEGLGAGRVNSVQLDSNGALWAATDGGLSRIKNGRVITLTSKNGLPCDTAHDVLEDDAHTFWVRMACGLVRIPQAELDAWVHDPQRMVKGTVFDTSDGVRSHSGVYQYGPRVAKTADGRLWFLPLVGVMVVDPHYLPSNQLPPPVHIEQITADGRVYTPAAGNGRLRLPPLVHDLTIDFAGLSFVAPEKVHFRFKLQGQDEDWREVVNDRKVQYSNLAPRSYRFLVKACNNSGVWNQEGAFVDFVIVPAWYQTNWFRALCAAAFLGLLWAAYQVRIRQLQEQERKFREAVETMPALAFIARPDGYRTFVNQRWVEYTGLTEEQAMGSGWEAVVHPDDLKNIIDLRRT